ncbi:plasmodesmata-located protein 6 [Cornus florida]|uniref:plasmodesmata-located protein 6 n=1 Tax=Cornus florida TaxID=4283 RepID=UPI00289E62D3|nr:plasmodesmata-located protein 6 [Cornus florida]
MSVEAFSLSSLSSFFIVIISLLTHPSASAPDSFVYGGCSRLKYAQGSPYESNVNSILTSVVNSASISIYNNFKIAVPGSSQNDVVYGLFQCRGDLSSSDCRDCVARSVSQLGVLCAASTGGALQLDGCFVKYDNTSFLGVEDKTVVFKRCGPPIGYDSDSLTRRDGMLAYLAAGGQFYRVGGSGNVQGVVQCVQDLSVSKCQDCISEAIGRLRSDCGSAAWGDMFLSKCYARYSERGDYSKRDSNDEDNDTERTLAILIGVIAVVAFVVIFLSFLLKKIEKKGGK